MDTTPHRSALVKSWNAVAPLLPDTIGAERVSLEHILTRLRRRFGDVPDWDHGPHIDALRRLGAALDDTGDLHPFGAFYVTKLFEGLLENRARLVALWRVRPELLDQPIARPLIILGLPRSGTSFLFNLLAHDPAHRYLSNWETTVSQIPPATPTSFERDPRRRTGRVLMHFQKYLAPGLKEIQEFHLDGPEECTPLLMQGFSTQALAGMFNVPAYSRWLDGADHGPTYRHHKRCLQTLQTTYPGERWLLKSPDHLAALDALLATYPDACLVHLHRDPVQSVSSWASLNAAFRGICSKRIDRAQLGAQVLERLATDMDAYLHARSAHSDQRFFDIPYRDLIADPMRVVTAIYRHFDLPLAPAAANSMTGFLERDRDKARKHRYAPQDFALDPEQIRERFAAYMDRFDIGTTAPGVDART